MPLDATSAHLPIFPDPAQIAAEMAHCRGTMLRIMDMAAEVAATHHAQITAQPAPATPSDPAKPAPTPRADLTLQFERAAKTARDAAVLVRYFARPLPTQAADPAAESRVAKRRLIIRSVEDDIARQGKGEWAERMLAELRERIEMPEFDDELAEREVETIIRELLRDLALDRVDGVTYWKRRTPADITALAALAAKPPASRPPLDAKPCEGAALVPPAFATLPGRNPQLNPADAVAAVLAHAGRLRSG